MYGVTLTRPYPYSLEPIVNDEKDIVVFCCYWWSRDVVMRTSDTHSAGTSTNTREDSETGGAVMVGVIPVRSRRRHYFVVGSRWFYGKFLHRFCTCPHKTSLLSDIPLWKKPWNSDIRPNGVGVTRLLMDILWWRRSCHGVSRNVTKRSFGKGHFFQQQQQQQQVIG